MTLPALIAAKHRHITEREVAHVWPDGEQDDRAWEDCTWCAAVMLAHFAGITDTSTHTEAEALRHASGKGPLGGSNADNVIAGYRARYDWTTGGNFYKVYSAEALWADLTPGSAAAVSGSMGAFPYGHTLRRWDPSFGGGHETFIVRVDDSDRVWWDDPLAPQGGTLNYQGQWVTKDDLFKFIKALGSSHLIVSTKPPVEETPVSTFAAVTSKVPALIDVNAGSVLIELDGTTIIKTLTGTYPGEVSPLAAGALRLWTAKIGGIERPVYVKAGPKGLNIRAIVDSTPYDKAALDAAGLAGEAKGAAAIKADIKSRLGI